MHIICRDDGSPYAVYSDGYRSFYWSDSIHEAVKDFTWARNFGLMKGNLMEFTSLEEALKYGDNNIVWSLPFPEPFDLPTFMEQYPEHFI